MAEVKNWCDICGPSVQHKESCIICGECFMHFCVKCYDFHLDSCRHVVAKKYHECVQHHLPVRGFCFTCNILTCVTCKCMRYDEAPKHEDRNLREAFYLINKELDRSIQDLDLRDTQIESRLESQKIRIKGSKECQQCKRSVQEHIDDTCGNEEHFFGRLELLKPRLAKVKENLEFIKGETNPILFLAKWKNPNTVISSIDEVLRMKQFDFANDSKLPIKYGSEVNRSPDPSTKPDDIVEELTSALQEMTVKDKKAQVHTSGSTNVDRLSILAGEKLTESNPDTTYLCDRNRPTKIGERYRNLYEEWSDSMDLVNEVKVIFPDVKAELDDIIVHHLYRVLTECFKECKKESELQLKAFGFKSREFPRGKEKESETNTDFKDSYVYCESSFHDKRKQNADYFVECLLQERTLCQNITESWDYRWKSEAVVKKMLDTPFFRRCVTLCWYMVIQDPMMYLDNELPKDSAFDRHLYEEFVQKGNKMEFVVWPALFLHKGGPLMCKGVVQAYSRDN